MDNMRVHHSLLSREAYDALKLTPVFNIPYSPQFNPIEAVFSMVKSFYKSLFL
jgi:transposase